MEVWGSVARWFRRRAEWWGNFRRSFWKLCGQRSALARCRHPLPVVNQEMRTTRGLGLAAIFPPFGFFAVLLRFKLLFCVILNLFS